MALVNYEEYVANGGLLDRVKIFKVTLEKVDPNITEMKVATYLARLQSQAQQGWVSGLAQQDAPAGKRRKSRASSLAPSTDLDLNLRFDADGKATQSCSNGLWKTPCHVMPGATS